LQYRRRRRRRRKKKRRKREKGGVDLGKEDERFQEQQVPRPWGRAAVGQNED
jgi:hypothetical protein